MKFRRVVVCVCLRLYLGPLYIEPSMKLSWDQPEKRLANKERFLAKNSSFFYGF